MSEQAPWTGLSPAVAAAIRPTLPDLVEEIIAAVSDGVPDYRRPLEGAFGAGLRVGVEEALRQFVDEIEGAPRAMGREVYVELGRGEVRAGRTLDALLAAYRVGARVAWRRVADAGRAAGLEPDTLYVLAESIFAYIDELSAASAEGYALEQSAAAGAAEQRRRALVRLLVQEPAADPLAVQSAAEEIGWRLPRSLAALVVSGDAGAVLRGLPPGVLTGDAPGAQEAVCLLVPDPGGPKRRDEIARAVESAGAHAALGPTVGWTDAAHSLVRAVAALSLARGGDLGGPPLVIADEHLPELLLAADPRLTADIVASVLAPLDGSTPAARARLSETLAAWLEEQGRATAVAERLGLHPQTIRYRIARLRELFGGRLDDPKGRFELALALHAERLALPGGAVSSRA
jgi:hypothetical protein